MTNKISKLILLLGLLGSFEAFAEGDCSSDSKDKQAAVDTLPDPTPQASAPANRTPAREPKLRERFGVSRNDN